MTSNTLPMLPQRLGGLDIYEIKVGIFATQHEVLKDILPGFSYVLNNNEEFNIPTISWDLAFVGPEALAFPNSEDFTTISDLYQDQQETWLMLHPDKDAEERNLHEIQVGVYCTEREAYALQTTLLNYLSPTDTYGMPLMEEDYQWKTWILTPTESHAQNYLYTRHGDIAISTN